MMTAAEFQRIESTHCPSQENVHKDWSCLSCQQEHCKSPEEIDRCYPSGNWNVITFLR